MQSAINTASQALQQAVAAHNSGNLQEAEKIYKAILKSHSRNLASDSAKSIIAQTYCNLGIALHDKGDLLGSIDCYKNTLKIKPYFIQVYFLMGLALRDQGDLFASINCFKQATELEPTNADTFINLGAAQQHAGELSCAVASYKQALALDPVCAEAYNNMGSALHGIGELDAAIESFRRALDIEPNYINAHNNLGHALHDIGDLKAGIDSYKNALKIEPDSAQTKNNIGNALRDAGEYQEAIEYFDMLTKTEVNASKPEFWFNSKSQALECLYILGRYKELEERLIALANTNEINLRIAAVSTFMCNQLKIDDPYPFCKEPLNFFQVGNLGEHVADLSGFVESLILEADQQTATWEPQHGVTKSGFQTAPTIFKAGKNLATLENILRKEIEAYHSKYSSEDCAYINLWPKEYDLRGWFVRLLQNGYQQTHNHPSGWLSGIIYLKTVDPLDSDEGAIEMSLHGHDLPILDNTFPRTTHRPKKGDIILFPSSLFHRTIPYSEDTDRCVIAFDIYRYSR
jgi:tetratricopeptide (TPR) repeat protein